MYITVINGSVMSGTQGGNTKKTGKKRKGVVLSIEDKLKILKLIDSNVSYTVILQCFDIGQNTVELPYSGKRWRRKTLANC